MPDQAVTPPKNRKRVRALLLSDRIDTSNLNMTASCQPLP